MKLKLFFKKVLCLIMITAIFGFITTPNIVRADTAPKPFIEINFKNINQGEYFVTLLSKNKSSGPAIFYDGENYKNVGEYPDIWEKFQNYPDDYYFLQYYKKTDETNKFNWNYYPPVNFKLLIYFPSLNKFIISEPQSASAFANYYTFDLKKLDLPLTEVNEPIKITHNKKIGNEIFNFLIRLIFTIVIEIAIALLFKFNSKRQINTILITNLVTQIALNIVLSMIIYLHGYNIYFIPMLLMIEILIFIVEAVVYSLMFKKYLVKKRNKIIPLYVFIANSLSFVLGLILVIMR